MTNRLILFGLAATLLMTGVAFAKDPPAGKLKTISVAEAFASPDKHEGKIGIEGTVIAVDSKALSFSIHTPNPPDACQEECCAPKQLPVSVPKADFKGKLPKKNDKVVVVGEFKALTVGFDFTPVEVRVNGKVVISKT